MFRYKLLALVIIGQPRKGFNKGSVCGLVKLTSPGYQEIALGRQVWELGRFFFVVDPLPKCQVGPAVSGVSSRAEQRGPLLALSEPHQLCWPKSGAPLSSPPWTPLFE